VAAAMVAAPMMAATMMVMVGIMALRPKCRLRREKAKN
jgi:hypothetical protein